MAYLIDTHVLLWFSIDSPRLPVSVRAIIADPDNDIAISIASYWEIAIKAHSGKLDIESDVVRLQLLANKQDISISPISIDAIHHTTLLPLHHKDPFDRIIAATALVTGATVVSADTVYDAYGVSRVWG